MIIDRRHEPMGGIRKPSALVPPSNPRPGKVSVRSERIVVLGMSRLCSRLLRELQQSHPDCFEVVGIVVDQSPGEDSGWRILGGAEELSTVVRGARARRVVVASADRRDRLPLRGLMACWLRGIAIESIEDLYERTTGRVAIEALTPSCLVFGGNFRNSSAQPTLSRALSLVGAAGGLVLLFPFLALIALLIKLDSRGPVLFLQDRIGLSGTTFRLIKFRTMHSARDNDSEWVRDNQNRITRVGLILRKFRLDELPQFVNILRGEMNLVGPRPHPASNLALLVTVFRNTPECGTEIPYYSLRTLVRPGVTGWAQVRYGYANDVQEEVDKLGYDLYYVKHCSVWLDLRILLQTIRVVLRGQQHPVERYAAESGGWRTV